MHKITYDLNIYSTPTITAKGEALSLVRQQGDSNLWITPGCNTGQLKQITSVAQGTEGAFVLDWPPGGRIFYTSTYSGALATWSINPDGSNPQNVTNTPRGHTPWSLPSARRALTSFSLPAAVAVAPACGGSIATAPASLNRPMAPLTFSLRAQPPAG